MFNDVIQHFGSQADTSRALGVSRAAVAQWKAIGGFPPKQCFIIEEMTGGQFKASDLILEYYGISGSKK